MNVTELPAQLVLLPEVTAIVTDGVKFALTFIVTVLEEAVADVTQVAFDVSTQVTASELFKVVLVYVTPVPAFPPFTFH